MTASVKGLARVDRSSRTIAWGQFWQEFSRSSRPPAGRAS